VALTDGLSAVSAAWVLLAPAAGVAYGCLCNRIFRYTAGYAWSMVIAGQGWAVLWLAFGWWAPAEFSAGTVAHGLYWLWRNRRRKGRLAAMGAKSRARVAAMARRMRERPARPVLRPVPQGAP